MIENFDSVPTPRAILNMATPMAWKQIPASG